MFNYLVSNNPQAISALIEHSHDHILINMNVVGHCGINFAMPKLLL